MSILLDIDPNGYNNNHFQKAIDQWQNKYDENDAKCNNDNQKTRQLFRSDLSAMESSTLSHDHLFLNQTPIRDNNMNSTQRSLRDTTPYGRGGWDPFHPSLERVRVNILLHVYLYALTHLLTHNQLNERPLFNFA